MSLLLEIEFLTGVCRAASFQEKGEADWPPQPDRVFSALTATWAARGKREDERDALEWMERQEPPTVHASEHSVRTAPDVFVPPNDLRASKTSSRYLQVLPEMRGRQPRTFPVACPEDPVMAFVWPDSPSGEILETLNKIAQDLSYLGHSASLVRCRFTQKSGERQPYLAKRASRRVYPGRLRELEQAHDENPARPEIRPGEFVSEPFQDQPEAAESGEWLVLEAIGGTILPDIRASALVCRAIRRALMGGYRRANMANEIPRVVSGHDSDGKPTRQPHLAVVPMAFAGFPHADGRVFGFALIPPTGISLSEIPGFLKAFAAITPYDEGQERRVLILQEFSLRGQLQLSPVGDLTKRSLSPDPYLKSASVWASVTPVVLDRHLKKNDENEVRKIVAMSCENAGLPRPNAEQVFVGKHSSVEGAPSTRLFHNAPPWTRWKVPKALATRSLFHVAIDFGQEVRGPVLLGAGRFTGLGLCRGIKIGG